MDVAEPQSDEAPPRPSLPREVGLGLALFGLYIIVDLLVGEGRRDEAIRNGRALYDLERALHIDIAQPLNAWLAPHRVLSVLANYEYAWTYILSALALMTWVWVRRPDLWGMVRDSFVVLNLISFSVFLLYPAAPPRMLSDLGFVDTVTRGSTLGSWGTSLVDSANQVAAMPSLHVGWALWVSVVLARITARRSVQLVSALHVLLTVYVVLATANHYLVDAIAVVVPVLIGVRVAERRAGVERGDLVPACDAFFLHVEKTGAAQNVGGLVIFAPGDGRPTLEEIRNLARTELATSRRFHQRVVQPGRWRRPRWVDTTVDLDWHVSEVTVDGRVGLRQLVAEAAAAQMPRDRPLWRLMLIRGADPGRSALLFLVHHSMADGIGTVSHALRLFRPRVELPSSGGAELGRLRRAGSVSAGLLQLATDGTARRLPGGGSDDREFGLAEIDLGLVRGYARSRNVRVTDVILALVAQAIDGTHPQLSEAAHESFRASVSLMLSAPGTGSVGNDTAAVMIDLPLRSMPFDGRLQEISGRTARLGRPTRALASRFVMTTGLRLLPEPMAGWFARTVYGGRFFHGVVSNLPGPTEPLTIAGTDVDEVLPVLPLAPGGAPLAVGALSWAGEMGFGIMTDPKWLDAERLADGIRAAARELSSDGAPATGIPAASGDVGGSVVDGDRSQNEDGLSEESSPGAWARRLR